MVESNKPSFKSFKKNEEGIVLTDLASNLKILEDRVINLRRKTQFTDQNLLNAQRDFSKERRLIDEEIMDLKIMIKELNESFGLMSSELKNTAKIKDFMVLNKYIDFWEPVNFLTKDRAEELIKEYLNK